MTLKRKGRLADAMRDSLPEQKIKTTSDLVSPVSRTPKKTATKDGTAPSIKERAGKTGMVAYVNSEEHRDVSVLLLDLKSVGIKLTKDELLREGLSMAVAKYKKKLG